MTSLGSLVEIHRTMSARSGLTPPPRFLSMKDNTGTTVMSELTSQLENVSTGGADTDHKPRSSRHRSSRDRRRNSALPSLSPSRSGSSSLSSSHGHGKIPSKYSPLDPIKTRNHREHKHIGRSRRRSTSWIWTEIILWYIFQILLWYSRSFSKYFLRVSAVYWRVWGNKIFLWT